MTTFSRRKFNGLAAATATLGAAQMVSADDNRLQASRYRFDRMHDRPLPQIGMLFYPGLTLMDLLGPQTVLSTSCNVHLLWKNKELIESDSGIVLRPNTTFAECPHDLDAVFVGGGPGQTDVMTDDETICFLADRGSRAKFVTSVCSGSLVLGAAGLLRGYEATSHWACVDALRMFGAKPVARRVVVDRNRLTGGGVTAGIDFGLTLLATLLGEDIAKMTQLALEYDPQPPFSAGTPEAAGPEVTKQVRQWMEPFAAGMIHACSAAAKKMPT